MKMGTSAYTFTGRRGKASENVALGLGTLAPFFEFFCQMFPPPFPGGGRGGFTLTGALSNGNRTEWSPIRSVIIRVITKSDDRAAGVRFVYHEYDYRLNWTT